MYLALLRAGASPRDSILSPKVRCRGAAHPCPAEARHPRADLGYVGEFERTWDSERAHGPNPAAATAHRRFLKRLKGLPFADPWRVGPAPASHGAPRPRDRVSRACTARIRQPSGIGFFGSNTLKTMAQLAAPPATALRPHTPPPIAAPVNIRPGEKTRGVFGSWTSSSSSGTRSSPPINVPQHDDDEDEAAAVSQQDSLYEYRRYLFWLRLRRGGIAGGDYEAENGAPPPRRSRSPPLSSSYRRALSKPPEELFAFDL